MLLILPACARSGTRRSLLRRTDRPAESVAAFERIVKGWPQGIVVCDAEGSVQLANAPVHQMVGDPPGIPYGTALWASLSEPRDAEHWWHAASRDEAGAASNPLHGSLRCGNGNVAAVRIDSLPLEPPHLPGGRCFLVTDERPRATLEQRLHNSEASRQILLEHAFDGVAIVDDWGMIRYISPAVRHILGYEPERMVGSMAIDFVHPDDRERLAVTLQKVLSRPRVAIYSEGRFIHQDGGHRVMESRTINLLENAPVNGIVTNFRDVTARRKAEESLRRSEIQMRTVMATIPAYHLLVSPEGRIEFLNRAPPGMTLDELIGSPLLDHVPVSVRSRVADVLQLVLEEGDGRRLELAIPGDAGGEAIYSTQISPVREGEHLVAVAIVATDVTMQRQAEESLRNSEIQLRHVSRLSTLGEMVAGIAHEINQPLHAVASFAGACHNVLQASEEVASAKLRPWIDDIQRAARQAGAIVRRLKDFAGRSPPCFEPTPLNQLVSEALRLVEFEARQQGVRLEQRRCDPEPRVLADRVQIQQVIVNLVRNAIDALAECPDRDRHVVVESICRQQTAIVRCRDNGPGLKDCEEMLFKPFETTKATGLGLGLAISRSIVRAHHGRLWNEATEHATTGATADGAVFCFELPLAGHGGPTEPESQV